MSFNLIQLFLIGITYLLLLFGIAWATDKGFVPKRIVRHPVTYVLSLGVYASAWAFYGSVGLAYEFGYGFLAYYFGVCGAFLLAPVLMLPILRITRAYQLSSLADLFAFRYRSQFAGTLVTFFTLMGTLALLSLQIQAVASSIEILAPGAPPYLLGFGFCLVITIFTFLFGARGDIPGENNDGLVVSIAFESIIKLVALMAVGFYAVSEVFGGFGELNDWLQTQGPRVTAFEQTIEDTPWRALLLIFFASALVMPHMFHMTFTENQNPQNLFKASWGLPLYLLLISLPIPPILWAGINLNASTVPEYYTLGVSLTAQSPVLSIIVFVGGLSAASGMIIVTTLALAGMVLNHLVLPVYPPKGADNIYSWLKWVKRGLIALIIFLSYLFYLITNDSVPLSVLGILAFSAMLQLLPGALAVLYWPIGNRLGVVSGMITGIVIWGFTMLSPLLFGYDATELLGALIDYRFQGEQWHIYTFFALTANVTVFALVSILTEASRGEEAAAQACSVDTLSRPQRRELVASSSADFKECLSKPLGAHVANREVERALMELKLPAIEYRPYALRRLRDQIEANLSGLMGPSIAQDIVKQNLSYKQLTPRGAGQDIHFVERSLEDYQSRLTGLAAELDSLRRYHRQTLQNLPIAACSLGHDLEILMWNQAMSLLTGVSSDQVIGSSLSAIPTPWAGLLNDFAQVDQAHLHKKRIDLEGQPHWFNLHKSLIAGPQNSEGGLVILLEDQTENQLLEEKLIHSSRLASVGRFAAGVAHEIGNPVTGIACLAQNMKLETDDKEMLTTAQQIIDQTKRISNILQSLMNFSRSGNHSQSSVHEPTPINRCVQEAINLLSLSGLTNDIEYQNQCDLSLTVIGDQQRLVQVFINLLSNARDASPSGSVIEITGKIDGYSVIIDVSDQGSGIPKDQLDHIFEPFYTTKDPNKGTGLGLSLVYSIIEEHYGQIKVISPADKQTGRGTRVRLSLPAYQPTNPTNQPAL